MISSENITQSILTLNSAKFLKGLVKLPIMKLSIFNILGYKDEKFKV
jgi:hypothetical protein